MDCGKTDNIDKIDFIRPALRPEERERLAALANLLKTDHRLKFQMDEWLYMAAEDGESYGGAPLQFYAGVRDGSIKPACKTAACALGHCPLIEGMELTDGDLSERTSGASKVSWETYGRRMFPTLFRASSVSKRTYASADLSVFYLTEPGLYVFGSWNYTQDTQDKVANRILDFLARGYPAPIGPATDHRNSRYWRCYTNSAHTITHST